ncbi:Tricalbin-1-like, partial [Homarus americanus]
TGSGVLVLLVGVVVGAWVLGSCGASWAWLMVSLGVTWALVSGALQRAAEDATRYESLRLHRRRALQADETCEWLNILVNRWWVFSSASIFARVKAALDPRLNDAKPAFLDRTPVLRSVRTWDVSSTGASMGGGSRRPMCPSRPPPGLAHAPTHTLALMCDLALDSDSFSAVLAARIGSKGVGVDLDVGVEKLAVLGRVVVTATLDMEAPFPHVTRLSLSFTEKPQVWFSVRILKAVQMMEVPVLKTWLHSLVMDALATAWVDPGQLEVNIHSTDVHVPETRPGDTLAQGVLTVIIWTLKATSGVSLDEDKWVVLMVDGQQHVTPTITSPRWQEACSFLVSSSPNHHNLVLKVKTKRLITTTLTQYDLPLSQYGLDSCRV